MHVNGSWVYERGFQMNARGINWNHLHSDVIKSYSTGSTWKPFDNSPHPHRACLYVDGRNGLYVDEKKNEQYKRKKNR